MWIPSFFHVARLGLTLGVVAVGSAQCALPTLTDELTPGNFHVLDAGRAYRSAQPTGAQLEALVHTYGIQTVLNLRGPNAGKDWYDEEAAVCAAMGVAMVDFPMSAKSLPPPDLLKGVVATLKNARYPMLIHCSGGADRSGAVSAIYRMLIRGDPRDHAVDELSPEYLHFRAFNPCMDTLAEIYEPTDAWLDWYAENRETIVCR